MDCCSFFRFCFKSQQKLTLLLLKEIFLYSNNLFAQCTLEKCLWLQYTAQQRLKAVQRASSIKVSGDFRLDGQSETETVALALFLINSVSSDLKKGGVEAQSKLEAEGACLTATKNKSQSRQQLNPFWPKSRQTKGETGKVRRGRRNSCSKGKLTF